ncbi:MAG: hypothetical protein ABIJ17_02395 [Patescibacteria group bacterium]
MGRKRFEKSECINLLRTKAIQAEKELRKAEDEIRKNHYQDIAKDIENYENNKPEYVRENNKLKIENKKLKNSLSMALEKIDNLEAVVNILRNKKGVI